jgi:hypothetical protein
LIETLGEEALRYVRRNRPVDFLISRPDFGSLERGRFTYLPVVPGGSNSPSKCAGASSPSARRWSPSSCPPRSKTLISTPSAAAADLGHLL